MILKRARPDIVAMTPYSSARSLVQQNDNSIYLDANEMPFDPVIGTKNYNRYAPQQPQNLLDAMAKLYDVDTSQLLVSRGADESIDILTRLFCTPGSDNVIICPPAFPMYEMAARLNGTAVQKIPLNDCFQVDVKAVLDAVNEDTKILYLCSPNNPTANLVPQKTITDLCEKLSTRVVVVVDEAYIEFANSSSATKLLNRFENLVVLRTLSKAMALAGVRCGCMVAAPAIIKECLKILAPYPLPVPVIETVLQALQPQNQTRLEQLRRQVLQTKEWFISELKNVETVTKIFPSDSNFILVNFKNAEAVYQTCKAQGIVLRLQPSIENCIRISIGARDEMEILLQVLKTGARPEVMQGRCAHITRKTKETAIDMCVDLDATTPVEIYTGIGFYDHMLEQIAQHGGFALKLQAVGDTHIDLHHTIEDCAIALGQAIKIALGNKAGISRYGFTLPMDEAQASVVLDLSGRSYFKFDGAFKDSMVGGMPVDMVAHIFRSIAENLNATIHVSVNGENTHHMVEACFKAFGRALRQAIAVNGLALPSTKGVL